MNNILNSKANRRKLVTCVLSFVFFLEGMMFFNHYSYAYHVDQVRDDLSKLEKMLEGNASSKPLGASLLDIYEPTDDFGDIRLRNLTGRIVNSTEYAIENADELNQVSKLKKAVDEIAEVQEMEVNIIHDTLQKIETDDISQQVEATYNKAVVLKDRVAQATEEIQTAIDNNQQFIEIDIVTDKDDSHGKHAANHEEEEQEYVPHDNPNIDRILRQKVEDAAQREANRQRIKLIEKGREAQKAQKLKNKVTINNQKNKTS
ncbi:hypothetical protein JXD20_03605 [Candidatus Peregrinibacteria bacterium]|nr:hypothetical protein [Candidatus Peregrinibacteria bacterium]